MTVSRRVLCWGYGLIAVLAFVGTWGNILGLLQQEGFLDGTVRFWQDVLVNEASRFITMDTLFLGLAVVVWMVLEARRLEIPGVWVYVVFGLLIAISAVVPLFMIHRERRLAALQPGSPAGVMRRADLVGLAVLTLAFTIYAASSLAM
jgi:hypothetical protein